MNELDHASWPDDVRRMYEGVNQKSGPHTAGTWYWVRLTDGKVSPTLFDTRAEALDAYDKYSGDKAFAGKIQAGGISHRACSIMLRFHRDMVDAGYCVDDREHIYKPHPFGIEIPAHFTNGPSIF